MRAIIDTAVDAITVIDRDARFSKSVRRANQCSALLTRTDAVARFFNSCTTTTSVVLASIRKIFDEGQASTARFACYTMTHWITVESRAERSTITEIPGRRGRDHPGHL